MVGRVWASMDLTVLWLAACFHSGQTYVWGDGPKKLWVMQRFLLFVHVGW